MAEVLRALHDDDVNNFFPVHDLSPERHREADEAVGEVLFMARELSGYCEPGIFLVRLETGEEISYPFKIFGAGPYSTQ